MKKDYVLDEGEFSIAVHKISNLSLALSESIDNYISILSDLQTNGIKDDKICLELQEIMALAKTYQKDILAVNEKLAADIINPEISDVETEDCFSFPSDFMVEVTYFLSRFL